MPNLKKIQSLVEELELEKGFSRDINNKCFRLMQETVELEDAIKSGNKKKIAEECADCIHFLGSILGQIGVDGDKEFMKKYNKNKKRFKGKGLDNFK